MELKHTEIVFPVELTFTAPVLSTMAASEKMTIEFIAGKLLETLTAAQRRELFKDAAEKKELLQQIANDMAFDPSKIPAIPKDRSEEMTVKLKQEVAALETEGEMQKATTIFPRIDGVPIAWAYQVRGFCKTACKAMHLSEDCPELTMKAVKLTPYSYKTTIDLQIFVEPRHFPFILPEGADPENLEFKERSLRADTRKGERVCLARSEMVPEGTKLQFDFVLTHKKYLDFVKYWLDYGKRHGFLQWRSGGKGTFTWQERK